MMLRLSVLFAFHGLMGGSPSLAQNASTFPTVSRQDPRTLATLRAFASCVAEKDSKRTIAFLKGGRFATPDNPEVRALAATNSRCLGSGTLKFNQVWFAGAAAEALYHKNGFRFANHPISISAAKALWDLRSIRVMEGVCIALSQPREVDALFATEVASIAETRAVTALRGSVEKCMGDKALTPEAIRSVVAAGAFPAVASAMRVAR